MKTRWVRKSRLLLILVAGLLVGALVAPAASASEKLVEQIRVAITHATFSLNSDELGPRLTHAHHVVNILEGAMGPNFDGSKGNPGDGYGALNYAADAAKANEGAASALAQNTLAYLRWADEEAVAATRATDFAAAGVAIHRALAFLSAALGEESDDSVTIEIYSFRFGDGQPLTIRAGTTVTWINHDNAPHTATGSAFNSGTLNHGDSFSFTFTQPGVYEYICAFHPNMKHTIIVE